MLMLLIELLIEMTEDVGVVERLDIDDRLTDELFDEVTEELEEEIVAEPELAEVIEEELED